MQKRFSWTMGSSGSSRSLQLDVGESLLELGLLPRLLELEYSETDDTGDAFVTFVTATHNPGPSF